MDIIARLRSGLPRAIMPAFEQAILKVELWLSELSTELARNGEPDGYEQDRLALQAGAVPAGRACRAHLLGAIDALPHWDPSVAAKPTLSLIDESQMDMQLAAEGLVERLSQVQHKGLEALDRRFAAVLHKGPFGPALPLSPQTLADAARNGLAEIGMDDMYKALVVRHFESLVDPVLSDLLKEYNAALAELGVLPDLVIQDEEERQRRAALKAPRDGAPPGSDKGKSNGPELPVDPADRELYDSLRDLVQGLQAARAAQADAANRRPMAVSETLSVLGKLQKQLPDSVLSALSKPGASIADTIKQAMMENAASIGLDADEVALAPTEEVAVDMVGGMFEMMLKDQPHAAAVAPVLARMVAPIVKAAVMDPELFLKRHHPARQMLNTVTEACEDNPGESPQDKALLGHVESAVTRLSEEFHDDFSSFEQAEQQLSAQMESHRKRVALSEKRAAEAQNGQERLELARTQAANALSRVAGERSMPESLRSFLGEHWQHHLSITALRQGNESPDWQNAYTTARHWVDLLDQASLGEPLPARQVESLREPTVTIWASSGIQGDAAAKLFQSLLEDLSKWSEDDQPVAVTITVAPLAAAAPARPTDAAGALRQAAAGSAPPTPEELEQVRALKVGTWVQWTKEDGSRHKLKVSWISGISGLTLFVNRRGARVMALSPQEIVQLYRTNAMALFEREAPVDQAMVQMLDMLRKQAPQSGPRVLH
jgi:hypothetical protein